MKLPAFDWVGIKYLKFLLIHFKQDDCQQKSASLTYTTLLSLIPIITVMIVVFSMVPALADAREQLQQTIYDNLLPMSKATISGYINDFTSKSSNLGVVGIVGLFVTTIMTLLTIEEAFNKIWRVQEKGSLLASVLRYWTMITLAPIVLGVAFGANSAIRGISFLNKQVAGYGIDWAIWAQIVSFVVMTMGFIGMYWFIPKAQVPIKNATIAGVVIAVLFETLKQTFGLIMTNFTSYEAIYGAFAALPVFLMWIYLSWNIILLGVEISYTLTIFDPKGKQQSQPMLSLLEILCLMYNRHKQGKIVSENDLRALLHGQELSNWRMYVHQLITLKLVTHTKDDHYILRTDLDTIKFADFYHAVPYALPTSKQLYDNPNSVWKNKLTKPIDIIETHLQDELDWTLGALFDDELPDLNNKKVLESANLTPPDLPVEPDALKSTDDSLRNKVQRWLKHQFTKKSKP